MNISTIALFFLLAAASMTLHAQPTDTIVSNPKAVLLKRIWMVRGSSGGEERVGEGAGSLRNINGDQYQDFAIGYGAPPGYWHAYLGDSSISTVPIWRIDSTNAEIDYPVVGDFWGDGSLAIGMLRYRVVPNPDRLVRELTVPLYQVHDGAIDDTARVVFDPAKTIIPNLEYTPADILAMDIDRDGDDELVVAIGYTLIDSVVSTKGFIWIFAGGPNFQVDSPTVVLRDTEANRIRYSLHIACFDNDPYPDLLIAGDYEQNRANKLKFFWGKPSLTELSATPDRSITLVDPFYPRIGNGLGLADVDGDHATDLFLPGPDGKVYLWRMGIAGKDPRTRSLRLDDAEASWVSNGFLSPYRLGTLNDSTNRYEMIGLAGPSPLGGAMLVALSTHQQPMNASYEAYYGSSYDSMGPYNVFGNNDAPAGDVNGDGWSDYLTAEPRWPGNDAGIAMILAGGPYIPRDDNTTSVQDIPAEGKHDALAVWPNPVREVLNIAWRGDLQRMPRRFAVHSIAGERVAGGAVEPSVGAAVWHCDGVASGSYVLTAYDAHDRVIATTTIIKNE